MYYVKTRNWHCRRWVFNLLSLTLRAGAFRGDSYNDGDGKFGFESKNLFYSLLVFGYFMALSRWSGGWTYIYNRNSKRAENKFNALSTGHFYL
jgi:hypothetical protein